MIVTKIYGGLAGQMLQYAAGKHLSHLHKTQLFLDLGWFDLEQNEKYPRTFKLDKLNTDYNILPKNDFIWRVRFAERFKKINPFKYQVYNESIVSNFDKEVLLLRNNVVINGYFFSHKYFFPILKLLKKEFSIKAKLDERNTKQLDKIKSLNSVSIHVRRGDYALTDFHGILPLDYYRKAIQILTENYNDLHLFVFSDEPEWVVQNMDFKQPYDIIDYNRDEFNYIDIELMKYCKHNIIANSGFSWWGAILNYNASPTVIAPRKWVNQTESHFENIPSDWILLE